MTITVDPASAGKRIDALIAGELPDRSRSAIQKLIDSGLVTMKGKPVKKSYKAVEGDVISVIVPEPEQSAAAPEDIPLDIVYEDEDVVVVNKPKGLVVHPAPGHPDGTLVNALMHHCGDSLSGINGVLRPGIVHRIDKDTSGLIIAAKNDSAHRALAAQLKDHTLCREYAAVVCGVIKEDSGTVNAPIGRHPVNRMKQAVTEKNSRPAVTHWQVVTRYEGYTLVRCRLETGRTHQIRVHMAYIGHPVLGDTVYGRKKSVKGLEGQCLHAEKLRFIHPRTGEMTECQAPLPDYFNEVLRRLRDMTE